MEPDELFDFLHLSMVACGAGVQPLNDGTHVTEDARVHQCCDTIIIFNTFQRCVNYNYIGRYDWKVMHSLTGGFLTNK